MRKLPYEPDLLNHCPTKPVCLILPTLITFLTTDLTMLDIILLVDLVHATVFNTSVLQQKWDLNLDGIPHVGSGDSIMLQLIVFMVRLVGFLGALN